MGAEHNHAWRNKLTEDPMTPNRTAIVRSGIPIWLVLLGLAVTLVTPMAYADKGSCVEDWENESLRKRDMKGLTEKYSAATKAISEKFEKEREQNVMTRFLRDCEKYGFVWPRNEATANKNDQIANRLRKELAAAEAAERTMSDCDKSRAEIERNRARMPSLKPRDREAMQKAILNAENSISRECPR